MISPGPPHEQQHRGHRTAGTEPWAIILAGGDGVRLRELTRRIAGDERPKQFCRLVGEETLLAQTRRRAAIEVSPHRTLFSVTRSHERFYAAPLGDVEARQLVVQPANRGTAPAILYALLRVAAVAPEDPVAILPSDHFVSDDERFMGHVCEAFEFVATRPDRITLLGVAPDRPETEYGWIEPGEPMAGPALGGPVLGVRRFWEKPAPAVARDLAEAGALWNSFVMVGRAATFLDMVERVLPDLSAAFAPLRQHLDTPLEAATAEAAYRRLPSTDFSRCVLVPSPGCLAVLPVHGVEWSDLGSPGRVRDLHRVTMDRWEPAREPVAALAGGHGVSPGVAREVW